MQLARCFFLVMPLANGALQCSFGGQLESSLEGTRGTHNEKQEIFII
jgi:hypothetical protein